MLCDELCFRLAKGGRLMVTKGFLGSPKEVFMAIFESVEQAENAAREAMALGVHEQHTTILSPQDSDELDKVEQGGLRMVFRKALGLEELTAESAYATALENGQFVLVLDVPESEEQLRADIEALLVKHNSETIHYFGNLVYKEVAETTLNNEPLI
jgi:hypothetical protein